MMKFRNELRKVFNYFRNTQKVVEGAPAGTARPPQGQMSQPMVQGSSQMMMQQQQPQIQQAMPVQGTPQNQFQNIPNQLQMSPRRSQQQQQQQQQKQPQPIHFDLNTKMLAQQPQLPTQAQLAQAQMRQHGAAGNMANMIPQQQQTQQQQKQQQQFMPPQNVNQSATQPAIQARAAVGTGANARWNAKASTVAGAAGQTQFLNQMSPAQRANTVQMQMASQQQQLVPTTSTAAPAVMMMTQSAKLSPTGLPVTSPQGVPIYTQSANQIDASQLKLPPSRKRSLGGVKSSPIAAEEPPLKKERADSLTKPGTPASTGTAGRQQLPGTPISRAAEELLAKQRVAQEAEERRLKELAMRDPLAYALQTVADVCQVDPETEKENIKSERAASATPLSSALTPIAPASGSTPVAISMATGATPGTIQPPAINVGSQTSVLQADGGSGLPSYLAPLKYVYTSVGI